VGKCLDSLALMFALPLVCRRLVRWLLCMLPWLGGVSLLHADLVWSRETGWTVVGDTFAGLTGEEGRRALELMNRARLDEERGADRSALRGYRRVFRTYPKSIYAPEAYYRTAQIRLARGELYKAFEAYQSLLAGYPNTPRFQEVLAQQFKIATSLKDGARNRWLGLPGFRNRERAIQYYEQLIFNAPYSDYAPLALMNVAQLHQRLKQDGEAIDALDRLINFYPDHLLAPDAYLRLAQTHASLVTGPHYDQASTREAITYFEDFMILFPGDPGIREAEQGLDEMRSIYARSKIVMAEFYHYKRRNYVAARVLYNEAITAYPDSAVASLARERLQDVEQRLALAAQRAGEAAARAAEQQGSGERRRFLGLF
jgi:outer membrane protein assembly factor BamD